MTQPLIDSFLFMVSPASLGWTFLGVLLGLVFGAMPGLGGGMLMALMLPITFMMQNVDAQNFLISIYVGGVSGGLISGILLGVPGVPAAIMTTVDGGAMARKGLAARALSLGIMASFVGGMISWLALVLLAAPLAGIASKFKSFDYFAFVMLGIVLIAYMGGKNPVKGLMAGFFGIFVATIGFDSISASNRFTFGAPFLSNGFDIMPVLLGAFALRSVLTELINPESGLTQQATASLREVLRESGRAFRYPVNLVRSSLIGSWIGLLPGIGANIGAIMSYMVANRLAKRPEEFGEGSEEALVASEAGNNATVGGALIPMIALGIPGSGQDVILMAALILHAVQPGPLLVIEHPDIFYGVITSYFFANLAMIVLMFLAVKPLAKAIRMPAGLLAPIVLLFCVVGVVASHNRIEDLWVMLIFGFVGFGMHWLKFPLAPFVIGFVLGPLAEERLRSALMGTGGDFAPLIFQPVAGTILILCIGIALWPLLSPRLMSAHRVRTKTSG